MVCLFSLFTVSPSVSVHVAFSLHHVCCIVQERYRLDLKWRGRDMRTRRSSWGVCVNGPAFVLLINIESAFTMHTATALNMFT